MVRTARMMVKLAGLAGLLLGVVWVLAGALEDDHGNTPLMATPIPTDGTPIPGCIESPGDMDYFLFSAIAGCKYIIETTHLSPEMDTIIYLFGTDGETILAVDDNSGVGLASRLEWTCPESGTYFVMVRHAKATRGTGCYELTISLTRSDDHGNTPLTATPIPTDGTPIPGYIESPGDRDYFLFPAEEGWNYLLETSELTPEMDTVLALYGLDGKTLLAEDDNSGAGLASRIEWTCPESGTYFAAVHHADPEGTGGYRLAVKKLGYTDDHGNEPATATPIPTDGTPLAGRIEIPGDVDYFAFHARAGGEYRIETTELSSTMDTMIALYGPRGKTLLAEDDNSGPGLASRLEWTCPESGTYFIQVRHADPSGVGSYQLIVTAVLKLQEVGSFKTAGYALDVWVEGQYAYLALGWWGLLIIDVSEPAQPWEVGSHSTRGYAWNLQVRGRYAYIADRGSGLVIIDISDPAYPREVGTYDTPGSAWDVSVQGGYAYIADYRSGLMIVDITNPARPEPVSSVATSGDAQGVFISGSYAYVALGERGLEIIDISKPESPVSIASLDLPGEAHAIRVYKEYAYVASGYKGLRIVDISDPAHPREVGSYDTRGEAYGLFLKGSYLYIADQSAGLVVLSLADPAHPKPIGALDTPGNAVSVFVAGDYAYVADKEEGLRIIRISP